MKFPVALTLALALIPQGPAFAWEAMPDKIPSFVWFRADICMPAAKLKALQELGGLSPGTNSCCPSSFAPFPATRANPALLEPFHPYFLDAATYDYCAEKTLTDEEDQALLRTNREQEAQRLETQRATTARVLAERQRDQRAQLRETMAKNGIQSTTLCAAYGQIIRGTPLKMAPDLPEKEVSDAVTAAMRSRGLRVDLARVKSETFRIGDSACQLYAAWGVPDSVNRTVTSAGSSEQLVYGQGTYVYLSNGRVRAFQD